MALAAVGCYSFYQLPTSLLPSPSSRSFLPSSPHSLSSIPHLSRVPQAGSRRPAQMPPRERGGGHHARHRAGPWRLPPQRPARALPRPGPHAPISKATRRCGWEKRETERRGSKGRSLPRRPKLIGVRGEGRRVTMPVVLIY